MTGIIYAIDWEQALSTLKAIVKINSHSNIRLLKSVRNAHETYVTFDDGWVWYAIVNPGNSIGRFWDECYISRSISKEILNGIILPCARRYPHNNIPLEERMHYF